VFVLAPPPSTLLKRLGAFPLGAMCRDGEGTHLSEVRILSPDRQHPIVTSQPTSLEIAAGGFADNISFFVNVEFPKAGQYFVQTLINSNLFAEQVLTISDVADSQMLRASEAIN